MRYRWVVSVLAFGIIATVVGAKAAQPDPTALLQQYRLAAAQGDPVGLDGLGTLFSDERRHPVPQTASLLVLWTMLFVLVGLVLPLGSFFVLLGKTWARWLLGLVSVVVLVLQPPLCYAVLGPDGLLRDGVPLILTTVVALLALFRSRGAETWVRPHA